MTLAKTPALQRLTDALREHGCLIRESGANTVAQCPAHNDDNPSLSIGERRDGKGAILKCHAGCEYTDVLAALGMTDSDLFDDPLVRDALDPIKTYVYPNGRKNHRTMQNGKKTFWQEGASDKSLYAIDTIKPGDIVYLCEGEKAADFLRALGYTAVATGGSQRTCDIEPLTGYFVQIIADRDDAGRNWARRYAHLLQPIALFVCILQAKVNIDKADIVEHITAGYSIDELELVPIEIIEQLAETNGHDPTGLTDAEKRDIHAIEVARKAYDLRVAEEARALWNRQRAELMGQEPPIMVSMPDFLAIPDEEIQYRVGDLFPVGARILLAAQYKAGKTSLIANLLRSLVDGDQFLGKYQVAPIKRVLLIDTELDERTLRRWLREQTIANTEGINILSLRGRLGGFAITEDRVRADWARRIHGAELIMLDCLRPCLDALGLSEDKEAGIFLTAFDALCRESGAGEAVVVHHMGHTQERSRGDSRLLDWPDALWKLVRDTDENGEDIESGARFFSAIGRDVSVGESQLDWQADTRALSICGGDRDSRKAKGVVDDIITIMVDPANEDGLSQTQLVNKLKAFGVGRNIARLAVRQAVEDSVLIISTGPREAKIHTLNPTWRNRETEVPGI